MRCSFCGVDAPGNWRFCPSCGKEAERENRSVVPQFCASCGNPLQPGLKVCTSCGAPTAVSAPGLKVAGGAPSAAPYAAAPGLSQPPGYHAANQYPAVQERRNRGIAPILFWIPFVALLLISGLLFWFGKVSIVGWVVLTVCLLLLLFLRSRLLSGILVSLAGWVVAVVLLVMTLGITAQPSEGNSISAKSGSGSQAPAPAATAAPRPAGAAPATTPAARPTATTLKMDPPAQVKPLILAGPKPAEQLQYSVYLDGDNSYAYLLYRIRSSATLSNWSGDTYWLANIFLHLNEDQAKRHLQGQLKVTREDKGFNDSVGVFTNRVEKSMGKGDESYDFTRAWKDQPQAAWSEFIVRQGASWFYINTQRDTKNPVVPGDGIDTLLAELKKIDNKALIASATSGGAAGAAQPTARPNPSPTTAAASIPKVQNLTAGIGIDQTQKIQKPGNVFKPDTQEIAFSIEVVDVPRETAVDIQLFYLPTNDSLKGPTQKLAANQGVSRVGFTYGKPDKGWPAGQYKTVFYLDGAEAGALNFSVQP